MSVALVDSNLCWTFQCKNLHFTASRSEFITHQTLCVFSATPCTPWNPAEAVAWFATKLLHLDIYSQSNLSQMTQQETINKQFVVIWCHCASINKQFVVIWCECASWVLCHEEWAKQLIGKEYLTLLHRFCIDW